MLLTIFTMLFLRALVIDVASAMAALLLVDLNSTASCLWRRFDSVSIFVTPHLLKLPGLFFGHHVNVSWCFRSNSRGESSSLRISYSANVTDRSHCLFTRTSDTSQIQSQGTVYLRKYGEPLRLSLADYLHSHMTAIPLLYLIALRTYFPPEKLNKMKIVVATVDSRPTETHPSFLLNFNIHAAHMHRREPTCTDISCGHMCQSVASQ